MTFTDGWLSIANRALAMISRHTIDSFDTLENEEVTRTVKELLPVAVRKVLSEQVWSMTTRIITMARDSNGFFQLPKDFMYIVPSMSDSELVYTDDGVHMGFRLESDDYTDPSSRINTASITYVSFPSTDGDILRIPSYLRDMISYYLAYLISPSIGSDEGIQSVMLNNYTNAVARYRTMNGTVEARAEKGDSWWGESR